MIKEVAKDIYTFEVKLPNNPLKALNVYVVKGGDRTVVFDTGFNAEESKMDLLNGLEALDLKIEDVEVVLTHLHSDHVGLVNLFADVGCKVYAGKVDGQLINQMVTNEYWDNLEAMIPLYGMEEDEIMTDENPGYKHRLTKTIDYIELKIGDFFEVGDYCFEILDLSGHTPGHLGFYDKEAKIILSADTILDPITPNITFWGFEYPDILNTYVGTLYRLQKLKIDQALATHRKIITNHVERIDELVLHHDERLQEILDAMNNEEDYTVREISANISWRIRADNWDEFPKSQKWFATGETMAHLHRLVNTECVSMTEREGTLYFKKLQNKIVPFVKA
ncbi:MAG TPA: MBL fold metallo-hydrolase [Atopostipes sp.]|nr:MBL fold metallo-hydrolase [Atopostipes sp.]